MGINVAVFASGSGTNAENIVQYFSKNPSVNISLILSNKANAYVLERARKYLIPTYVFSKEELEEGDTILNLLKEYEIGFIVLAGFLLRIPDVILQTYPNKIINIHPSLLPKYGGKGMYGDRVHQAVVAAGDSESGITIHYINDKYDEGDVIFQATCLVESSDTPDQVATKVHALEYKYFPRVMEDVLLQQHLIG